MSDPNFNFTPLINKVMSAQIELLAALLEHLPADTVKRVNGLMAGGSDIAVETSTNRRNEVKTVLTSVSPDKLRHVLLRLGEPPAPAQ
jgi:hypothetical protein